MKQDNEMLSTERRLDKNRRKLERELHIDCLDTCCRFNGTTADISDHGIRARLDRAPSRGANIKVNLIFDDPEKPVESYGRVAWTSPLRSSLKVEAGLLLGAEQKKVPYIKRAEKREKPNIEEYENIETKKTLVALPSPESPTSPETVRLGRGEYMNVNLDGQSSEASILNVGLVDEKGEIDVRLKLENKSLWKKPEPELNREEIDISGWGLTPFSRLRQAMSYCSNIKKVGHIVAEKLGEYSLLVFAVLWSRIPVKYRARTLNLLDSLKKS